MRIASKSAVQVARRIAGRTAILAASLIFTSAAGLGQTPVSLPQNKVANQVANQERELFEATNRERLAHGLPALQWNDALAGAARKHANEMARKEELSHQFPGEPNLPSRAKQAGAHFVWLSENVAVGPKASVIHAEFVKSPPHRANILDSDMNVVGIGIVERDGQLFAVEDFSKAK